MTVAYQGEPGAFSERAALRLGGRGARLLACTNFEALFRTLSLGEADAVAAPWENTLAGPVLQAQLEAARLQCRRLGECTLAIHLHLVARPGTRLREVRWVASHPVALAQCGKFFAASPWLRPMAALDTAGSVRALMQAGEPARAAIAGAAAARIYRGTILRRNVQDCPGNQTRFLLLTARAGFATV